MNKDPPKSLFVTNLPYSLDLEDFKSYFTKFGPVERFDIPDHPNKPIAFVHFQNSEDAAKCLKENNGILYRGKILCIKFSSKAKPEHAPPLSSSVKSDADTSSSIDKPENESYSKHYDHDEIRSNSRRRRHEGNYNDYESRRRNPSPDYEFDRRRDPYSKYDYIDKPRDRIPYRDRIPREPPYYRERDMDYYYDDYRRDYPNYRHHRPSNEHRDRDTMRGYHERELRDERELREQREIRDQRDMDYYDYQYSAQPSSHQVSQSQLPKTIPYNVSQSSLFSVHFLNLIKKETSEISQEYQLAVLRYVELLSSLEQYRPLIPDYMKTIISSKQNVPQALQNVLPSIINNMPADIIEQANQLESFEKEYSLKSIQTLYNIDKMNDDSITAFLNDNFLDTNKKTKLEIMKEVVDYPIEKSETNKLNEDATGESNDKSKKNKLSNLNDVKGSVIVGMIESYLDVDFKEDESRFLEEKLFEYIADNGDIPEYGK